MKTQKVIYWTATGLVAVGMTMSAYMYLTKSPQMVGAFQSLGFPLYFMMILGLAKLLGAIALLAPVGDRLKEWAYAGFLFTFIGATVTHLVTGTPWAMPVIFLALLAASYVFRIMLKAKTSSAPQAVARVQHSV